jgi:hypothetical protein
LIMDLKSKLEVFLKLKLVILLVTNKNLIEKGVFKTPFSIF